MSFKVLLSFLAIYIIWGSTFTAIKYGLDYFPPFILAGLRFVVAGVIFLLLSKGKGFREMAWSEYPREILIGVLMTTANAGICWSELYVSSGVASLIVGLIPVMFVIFNWFGFEKSIPHPAAMLGLAIGIIGVVLISSGDTSIGNWFAVIGIIVSNSLWTTGSLLLRSNMSPRPYFTRVSIQLISGSIFLFIISSVMPGHGFEWKKVGYEGMLSVLYLGLIGTVLAYSCYSFLLKSVKPEITSTYALVNPLVAIFLGVIFLDEPFTSQIAISTILILLSVALVIYGQQSSSLIKALISHTLNVFGRTRGN